MNFSNRSTEMSGVRLRHEGVESSGVQPSAGVPAARCAEGSNRSIVINDGEYDPPAKISFASTSLTPHVAGKAFIISLYGHKAITHMTFLETKISGFFEIRPELVPDEHGFIARS